MSKLVFKVGEKELAVREPNFKENQEAQKIYNKAFRDAIDNGAYLRECMEKILREQGIWNNEDDIQSEKYRKTIIELEDKLRAGGIKKSEAKTIALDLADARNGLLQLKSKFNSLESMTAQSQADNKRFMYLVSVCLVYNDTGKPYFKDVDSFVNRLDADDEVADKGIKNLIALMYGHNSDYESQREENKFLKEYGFVNDKYQLIDSKGRLVDREGRLINENGRFIDENGKFVDRDGNPVTEDGKHVVEFKPFLDD
jgi:hypothetical protein